MASGGMASVLLCRYEGLGGEGGVKRLQADSPVDVEQRFVREAKLGASLNHPNLVSVFDTATDDEGVLIVMEYVEGEALARTLKRGPLPTERVASMVRGTAAYMAPEQLEGGGTTPATDTYALAVVAYEALTGERAREGRTPLEIAHRIATGPPPDIRDAMTDASPQAAKILNQAMARDPRERPGAAGELATGLARALDEPPTAPTRAVPPTAATRAAPRPAPVPAPAPAAAKPPPPTGPARRTGGPRGKRPIGAVALALALLALAAAGVIAAVLSSGGDDGEPQQANRGQEQQAQSGREQGNQSDQQQTQTQEQQAEPTPAPAEEEEPAQEPQEQTGSFDAARGAQLNEEGFALMQSGDYAGAVPILQEAVASWPEDSQDINYAYALFNLGKSLNRAGRPDEAAEAAETTSAGG